MRKLAAQKLCPALLLPAGDICVWASTGEGARCVFWA